MKIFLKVALGIVCLTSCTNTDRQNPRHTVERELQRLQGEWTIDSEIFDGQQQPDDVRTTIMTYKGHHWIQRKDGVIINEGNSEFRPETTPKQIDISPLAGPSEGKLAPGIYRLTGDKYECCFALPGKERPTDFNSKPGSGHFYVTFKRVHK